MKGFDFLHQRTSRILFTNEDNFLPSSFRAFYSIFEAENIKGNKFIDTKGDQGQIGALFFVHENQEIFFNQFLSLEEIRGEWLNAKGDLEWQAHKLVRIGLIGEPGFGGVYLSPEEGAKEQVFIYNSIKYDRPVIIASSIFDFVASLRLSDDFSDLDDDVSNLSKAWGDDHWRVKHN